MKVGELPHPSTMIDLFSFSCDLGFLSVTTEDVEFSKHCSKYYTQLISKTQHLNSLFGRTAGSNLRMVRPSLMSVVKLFNKSRAKRAAKFGPWFFSSEEVLSLHFSFKLHGILRPGSLVIMNVSFTRAYLGTYRAEFYYSNSRPHKCQTRNYVSTSAENGPAMARPAGPVPAPMFGDVSQPSICSGRCTGFEVPWELSICAGGCT